MPAGPAVIRRCSRGRGCSRSSWRTESWRLGAGRPDQQPALPPIEKPAEAAAQTNDVPHAAQVQTGTDTGATTANGKKKKTPRPSLIRATSLPANTRKRRASTSSTRSGRRAGCTVRDREPAQRNSRSLHYAALQVGMTDYICEGNDSGPIGARLYSKPPRKHDKTPPCLVTSPKPTTPPRSKIAGRPTGSKKLSSTSRTRRALVCAHLHHAAAPAECHRPAAHGAHAGTHRDGYPHPLAPHVRRSGPVDSGHGSRRHRHPDDGGAPARRRAQNPPADWAAKPSSSASGSGSSITATPSSTRCGGWARASTGRASTSPWMARAPQRCARPLSGSTKRG